MEDTYHSGRVHSIIFENEAQAFYILRMVLDAPDVQDIGFGFSSLQNVPVVVRGHVPGLDVQIGSWFGFEARWGTHDTYGKQLAISRAPVIRGAWTAEVAAQMLASHGIGEITSRRLLMHFGDKLVEVLDSGDPTALRSSPGMTQVVAMHTISRWQTVKAFFQTLRFLSESSIPKGKISQIWSTFGDEAEKVLSTDPWALLRIEGITFQQADDVARQLGIDLQCAARVRGAVLHACRTRKGMGHVYAGSGEILAEVQGLAPGTTSEHVAKAIYECHKQGLLVVDRKTHFGLTAIYDPWLLRLEKECSEFLVERLHGARIDDTKPDRANGYTRALSLTGPQAKTAAHVGNSVRAVAEAALQDWGVGSRINLTSMQMLGALNALTEPISILTGLPGTGKTTSLRAVVRVLQDAEIPFLLVAPTGIAAKRLTSVTGAPAATIHRAFGARGWNKGEQRESTYVGIIGESSESDSSDGSDELWENSPDKPHPADVVIVDESSMVDVHLLYRILTCTKPSTRLVFVGDAAQLPSVGPGNVLRDMLSTGMFPTVSLTEIFRQADLSDIVLAAHAVYNGDVPKTSPDASSEFVLISVVDEEQAQSTVVRIAQRLYEKREVGSFQVLSPRHAGNVGVTSLNSRLRELINPRCSDIQEMKLGSEVIREGDRIMVVKNNYELGVYNGDTGKVVRLDRRAREVEIKIHGPPIQYVRIAFKDVPMYLRLAYAITVHKSQGQEYDVIVLPIMPSFTHQLQRNLLYTAITRAKKRVYLVGKHEALVKAVFNNKVDGRNTLLTERLLACFSGSSGGMSASVNG